MADRLTETTPLPSIKAMVRGIQGFILFAIAGTALGMWWKRPAGLETVLSHLHWPFVAMLIPLLSVDYILGGLRYRLFFDGKILPHVSMWNCIRSDWANTFLGAVTPFQTGGGPAQLYILWRCGAKISDAVLASLINFTATLFFFMVSTAVAALLLPYDLFGYNFAPLLRAGFWVVGSVTGLMLVVLIFPTMGLTMVRQVFRLIPIRNSKFLVFRDHLLETLDAQIHRFREAFAQIRRKRKWLLVAIVVATMVLYSNKYLMGYAIARALGQPVPLNIFLGLQIIQLFLIYFTPTPGAAGVAELSTVWLMGKVLPEEMLLIYAVLWRFVATILGALIGGIVLLVDMRHWMQGASPAASTKDVSNFQKTTGASVD